MQEQYIRINKYGDKFYYKDKAMKILHRLDGPAVEWSNGDKIWFVNGKRHRLDGPAIEYSTGSKAWYVDGEYLTEEEFNVIELFNALSAPTLELTLEDIAAKFNVDASKIKIKK
jgi:hypothetical protein